MALSPEDRTTLIEALRLRYPSRDDLEQFLKNALNFTLEDISVKEGMELTRPKVVDHLDVAGRTAEFLEALRGSSGPAIRARLDTITSPSAVAPDESDFYYTDGLPFVDREDLRGSLDALIRGSGKRILIVHGAQRHGGRSHAREHIHQRSTRRGFQYVDIRLDDYASPEEEIRPHDLGLAIANRMNLKLPEELIKPDATRWTVNFLHWLPSVLNTRERWWIVIDDFDHENVEVPPAVYDFIEQLCKKMDASLSSLRLVLISFGKELPSHLKHMIEREDVRDISDQHLVEYFLSFFGDHFPEPASPEEERKITDRVRKSAQNVRNRMTGPRQDVLQQMKDAIIDEIGELQRSGGDGR